ncbi:DMT family transporter [Oceanicaulis sp. MMSF_3324]|uniref:DMT family transporter n=1 Tax=Oceanicaulis sp. MMSF_3324 TaxID=3046702 RepID=UPI00273E45DC|nr:DMT family transporter [Oceanicaulis sp. MMSF_3324]
MTPPSSTQTPIPGVAVLAVSAVVLGFASILVKASDLGPQAIAFWRLALGLPLLALALVHGLRRQRRSGLPFKLRPPGWKALALAGLFFAGDLAFWHAGIKITTAANATLLANLTPILVALAAWFLFQERPTRGMALAGGLAILGAICLAAGNVRFAPERVSGDILSALTAVWYTCYLLSVRAARRAGAATVEVMFWSAFVGAPIALLIALGFNEPLLPSEPAGWWPLLALALIVHVGGQGGVAYGLGHTPAALATLIILIQPVVSAFAGWVLFGEAFTPLQWIGAAFVLVGVYAAQRSGVRVSTPGAGAVKPDP